MVMNRNSSISNGSNGSRLSGASRLSGNHQNVNGPSSEKQLLAECFALFTNMRDGTHPNCNTQRDSSQLSEDLKSKILEMREKIKISLNIVKVKYVVLKFN